jgi:hypothetical protein
MSGTILERPQLKGVKMENEVEVWRPSVGHEGLLEVSSLGSVRALPRDSQVYGRKRDGKVQGAHIQRRPGKVLSPCVTKSGYHEIAFMVQGVRRKLAVHRLVGRAFVPGYFDGACIDHVDGNKLNNRASNLEWVTLSENTRRQWETGLVDLRGELAPGAKLTNTQAHAILCLVENGFRKSLVAEWFGVTASNVYKIAQGKRRAA